MVEIARADSERHGHVGLRQFMIAAKAAEAMAEEEFGGHGTRSVNFAQASQVIL
jgi:hypothetical protein